MPSARQIQLSLPYVFVADEPVYLSQVAPFMHYRDEPWPGTIFGGRFPIDVWPRPLMWAFEWHDTERELKLARGEPLFYCQFETMPQDRPIRLVEAERTPELNQYLEHISGAVNYRQPELLAVQDGGGAPPEDLGGSQEALTGPATCTTRAARPRPTDRLLPAGRQCRDVGCPRIETITTLANAAASKALRICHRAQVSSNSTMRAGASFSGHGFDSTSTRADRRRGTKLLLASIR